MGLQRRKAMFKRGSAALHATVSSLDDVYGCPLCLCGFPEAEVQAGGMLSEEHAPPESLGGEVVCLTCRNCNSSAGSQLDAHMERRESQIDFLSGPDTSQLQAQITITGVSQRVEISMSDGAIVVRGIPKRNHPEIPGQMVEALDALVEGERTDWSVDVEFQDRWLLHRPRVGWLRSGYLVAFAALGYRYILGHPLARVRAHIAAPDDDVIPLSVVLHPQGRP